MTLLQLVTYASLSVFKFGDTLTTELDLVCGQVAKRHFLDTVMMLGLLAGSLIAGPLGEIFI